jgi:hypothetical protein
LNSAIPRNVRKPCRFTAESQLKAQAEAEKYEAEEAARARHAGPLGPERGRSAVIKIGGAASLYFATN